MNWGTIVLTPFPFTDLTATKQRPCLVVSANNENKKDIIVAFISSVIPDLHSETDIVMPPSEASGLRKKSILKLDKLVTIEKGIVLGELGSIDSKCWQEINAKLKIALGLD